MTQTPVMAISDFIKSFTEKTESGDFSDEIVVEREGIAADLIRLMQYVDQLGSTGEIPLENDSQDG